MRKADTVFLLLLVLLSILLWIPRLRGPIDLRFDAGVYYVTGTSLAEGKGYRLLNEPGEGPAVQYPPALPVFVAVHQRLLGSSDPAVVGPWLRWSYFLIFTVYLVATYQVARLYLRPATAFVSGVLTGCFLLSYYLSDLLFTEIPFALVSLLFVLCNRRSGKPGWFAVTGILGMVAFLLRSAGVAVLAAWVAEALVQRRWRQVILRGLVAAVPVLGWQTYIASATSSPEYTQPAYAYQRAAYMYYNVPYVQNVLLREPFRPEAGSVALPAMAARVVLHLAIMPPRLGEVVSAKIEFWDWLAWDLHFRAGIAKLPVWIAHVPLTLLGLVCIVGAAWLGRRGEAFIPLYLLATAGVVALTPWPGQFARYLTPVSPLLALCLVLALVQARRYTRARWQGPWRNAGVIAMALVLMVCLGMQAYTLARTFRTRPGAGLDTYGDGGAGARLFYYDATWQAYADALAFIQREAKPDDVIAASIPHWGYLKSGQKTVMPPMELDAARGQALLDSVPVRYVIVDQVPDVDVARRYTVPTIQQHPQLWELVLTLDHAPPRGETGQTQTRVYRRIVSSATRPTAPDAATSP